MRLLRGTILGIMGSVVAACQAQTGVDLDIAANAAEPQFMREYGSAVPPVGYVGFCRREPDECRTTPGRVERLSMTSARWTLLNTVNTQVNSAVKPATDQEIYRRAEYWALPGALGDCEDYVLQKRKLLIAQGWPEQVLPITVVRDEGGDGHAVLTVLTDMGDLVLDNKTDMIRPWVDTSYVYYKRQSRQDPRKWVALTPLAQANSALAATRAAAE